MSNASNGGTTKEKFNSVRESWFNQDAGALVTANYLNGRFMYRTHCHKTVLFSQQGSVWQDVLPYCIINAILTLIVVVCKRTDFYDFTFKDQGHSYMSMLVSFLVVTRSSIAYQRYGENGTLVSDMMMSARELVQHTVLFTRNETDPEARKFRMEISRQMIILLRTVMYVLRNEPDRDKLYLKDCNDREKEAIAVSLGEANERTPNVMVIFLRSSIASHIKKLKKPLDVNEELALLTNVSNFIGAYHKVMKLVNSPFPFPLVQMTRTLLFIWIYSLPFALVDKMETLVAPVIVMFFMTFGFLGLEFLSLILDDPFGLHPIDFDVVNMGKIVFDDIYINLHDVDGQQAKEELQKVTSSTLSKAIKKEVRGHARGFSCHQHWTSLDVPDTVKEEDGLGGSLQEKTSDQSVGSRYFSMDDTYRKKTPTLVEVSEEGVGEGRTVGSNISYQKNSPE